MTPPHGAPPAPFLLHKRSEINPVTERSVFVVFGIKSFFENLCQSDEIAVDGTLKVAPDPFLQLVSVYFFYHVNDSLVYPKHCIDIYLLFEC